jgi:hypothetical protein
MKKSRYSDEQIVRILREADKDPVPHSKAVQARELIRPGVIKPKLAALPVDQRRSDTV